MKKSLIMKKIYCKIMIVMSLTSVTATADYYIFNLHLWCSSLSLHFNTNNTFRELNGKKIIYELHHHNVVHLYAKNHSTYFFLLSSILIFLFLLVGQIYILVMPFRCCERWMHFFVHHTIRMNCNKLSIKYLISKFN